MKCDLTIILLLKDRHDFNEQFLNYYIKNNINFKLIISDGGKKKLSKKILNKIENEQSIKYFSFMEDKNYYLYYKKIYNTLKKVDTKYVLFAANDDFFIYKIINKCVNFLNKNKNFIGASGTMIGFEINKKFKLKNFHRMYDFIELTQKNNLKRFNHYIKNFFDVTRFCIMKKHVLLKNYKVASSNFKNNIEFKDHFVGLSNVADGRIKIFKNDIILHQSHLNSEGNFRAKILKSTFYNNDFISDLLIFDKILSKSLRTVKHYVLNVYYNYILKEQIAKLDLQNEPSISEIKKIFFKKIQRKFFRKKKFTTLSFEKFDKETQRVIKDIEKNQL
jgi:glycosyltransferase domain-containing protein